MLVAAIRAGLLQPLLATHPMGNPEFNALFWGLKKGSHVERGNSCVSPVNLLCHFVFHLGATQHSQPGRCAATHHHHVTH
jgi:hypothetical protein